MRRAAAAILVALLLAGCGAKPAAGPTQDLALVYARALQTVLATASASQREGDFIPVTGGEAGATTASPEPPSATAATLPTVTAASSVTATLALSPTITRTSTFTPIARPTATRTPTPLPPATKTPTRTAVATPTRIRTSTPVASPTSARAPGPSVTAVPTPYAYQGVGSGTVDLPADAVGVLYVTHGAGAGTFTVAGYSSEGRKLDTLVQTTGAYDGRVALNLAGGEGITRLEVEGAGPWGIRYYPLASYDRWADSVPAISGRGDDVWFAHARPVQTLIISGNAAGRVFAVLVVGSDGYAVAVDTSDPYGGLYTVPERIGTLYGLVVTATDEWQITIVP